MIQVLYIFIILICKINIFVSITPKIFLHSLLYSRSLISITEILSAITPAPNANIYKQTYMFKKKVKILYFMLRQGTKRQYSRHGICFA